MLSIAKYQFVHCLKKILYSDLTPFWYVMLTFHNPTFHLIFNSCRPGFLPDPNDGSLYVLGGKRKEGLMVSVTGRAVKVFVWDSYSSCHLYESSLQKLPFTIPELVQSSPCRSSDGVLYTGNVKHVCVFAMFYGEISVWYL